MDFNSVLGFFDRFTDIGRFIAIGVAVIAILVLAKAVFDKTTGNYQYKFKAVFAIISLEAALYLYVRSIAQEKGFSIVLNGFLRYNPFLFYDRVLALSVNLSRPEALAVGAPILIAALVLFIGYVNLFSHAFKDHRRYAPLLAVIFVFGSFFGGVGLWSFLGLLTIRGFGVNWIIFSSVLVYSIFIYIRSDTGKSTVKTVKNMLKQVR